MFYTYVLQSRTTDAIYIGQTNNLEDRLQRHNSSRSISTKNRGPWEVIFKKGFTTRSEAIRLENKLKSFKNRVYLIKWLENN